MIKFYRGLKNSYNLEDHGRGIYFATDSGEILANGVSYGLSTLARNEIYSAINSVVAGVNFTAPGTFEFVDGNDNVLNTITLVTATQQQSGFLSAEDKKALDDLVNNKFSIKADDSILTLSESKELFTSISLRYKDNKVQLLGKESEVISEIDASDFIKDVLLSDARLSVNPEGQLEGTYLELVFNLDSGKDSIFVDVSSLIDSFDGTNIHLTGYTELEVDAAPITAQDSLNLAIAKLAKLIEENEYISASAFNDLNNRINTLNSRIENAGVETLQAAKDYTDDSLTWVLV